MGRPGPVAQQEPLVTEDADRVPNQILWGALRCLGGGVIPRTDPCTDVDRLEVVGGLIVWGGGGRRVVATNGLDPLTEERCITTTAQIALRMVIPPTKSGRHISVT